MIAMNKNKNQNAFQLPNQKNAVKRTKETVYSSFALEEDARLLGRGKQYYIKTYGCQANVRDSETMAGLFEMMGFREADTLENADIILFNTCAVRRAAELHVLGEIGSLKRFKNEHPEKLIGICGCMAQEDAVVDEVLKKYPQVDMIFGTHNLHRLPQLIIDWYKDRKKIVEVFSEEGKVIEDLPVKRTMDAKGFVNIMYGCNKFCTYCIVPYTRGKERSRKMEDILAEIRQLQETGRKEVVLLGQNVNAYGKDIHLEDGFTQLLKNCAETGIERIRFYTSHPRDYSPSTIDIMQQYPNVMKSLHLPVQSGSDEILRKMARGYTIDHYKQLFDEMKAKIPDITFTTDLIVGFPGETDEQFQQTLDLVRYCRFDLAYSFVYSPRSGTPAASMKDDIPMDVKKERLHILNDLLAQIANENNQKYLHKHLKVLCEGRSKKNKDVYSGYSEENKLVNFRGGEGLENRIVDVEITNIHSFSLDGKAL